MRQGISAILFGCLLVASATPSFAAAAPQGGPPLDLAKLQRELSLARGTSQGAGGWPREIRYDFKSYDYKSDSLRQEAKSFVVKKKPQRILPHAVGVAEILWAICPRERLVAFNELSADPDASFIAAEVRRRGPVFRSKETELVIGYQPDLVFTVFYSGPEFKEKLRQARIPTFDLGYFGSIESVKEQIRLIGSIIGEEGNAGALVQAVDARMRELKGKLPRRAQPPRVLYYDEGGYVPGESSNFTSICAMIGAVNVGAEAGIKSWSKVDYETVLKWNPDVIVVPGRSNLKRLLTTNRLLSRARAVESGSVHEVPELYLRAASQYMLVSADYLAGVVYRQKR